MIVLFYHMYDILKYVGEVHGKIFILIKKNKANKCAKHFKMTGDPSRFTSGSFQVK